MAKYFVIIIEGSGVYPSFENVIGDDISDALETTMDEIIKDNVKELADAIDDETGIEDHEGAYNYAYDIISEMWSNRMITKEDKGICCSYKTDKRRDNSLIIINSNNIYRNKTAEIIEILNTLERLKLPSDHVLDIIRDTAL